MAFARALTARRSTPRISNHHHKPLHDKPTEVLPLAVPRRRRLDPQSQAVVVGWLPRELQSLFSTAEADRNRQSPPYPRSNSPLLGGFRGGLQQVLLLGGSTKLPESSSLDNRRGEEKEAGAHRRRGSDAPRAPARPRGPFRRSLFHLLEEVAEQQQNKLLVKRVGRRWARRGAARGGAGRAFPALGGFEGLAGRKCGGPKATESKL